MRIEKIDKNLITLDLLMKLRNDLYYVGVSIDGKVYMKPLIDVIGQKPVTDIFENPNHMIITVFLEDGQDEPVISSVEEEEKEPPKDPARDKPMKTWQRLSYKVNCAKPDGSIDIQGRPTGEIRVSFKEKEDAEQWHNCIREIFYRKNTNADAITVTNLYDELGFKDILPPEFEREEGDKWGYLTIEHGTVKYISDVSKTKNTDMWGFTIKRPIKLYGMKDTKWWAKHQERQKELAGEIS